VLAIKNLIESVLVESDIMVQQKILNNLFLQLVDITKLVEQDKLQQFGLSGLLLPSKDAAACLVGLARTQAYWRAVLNAVAWQKSLKAKLIRIIYPGCGPFASLLLPLLVGLGGEELEITLIDIDDESIHYLNTLLQALNITSSKVQVFHQDILSFETAGKFDIMVSECMLPSLQYEGHVAITRHLIQYLTKQGTLIPECIEVNLQYVDMESEIEFIESYRTLGKGIELQLLKPFRHHIATLLVLGRDIRTKYKCENDCLKLTPVCLPAKASSKPNLMYTTKIKLLNDICLEEYQTGLTSPIVAEGLSLTIGQESEVGFRLYNRPEFFVSA